MFRTASSATAFARCSRPALLAVAGRGVVTVGRDPFTQTSSSPGCVPGQSPRPAVQIAGLNPHTKIVATIGPASEQMPTLEQVLHAGMRIMRVNFSHATYEEADLRVSNLQKAVRSVAMPVTISGKEQLQNVPVTEPAVLLDTQGPEIRTGSFADGVKEVDLCLGEKVTLTNSEDVRHAQTASNIWISYTKLCSTAQSGATILLDDGAIELRVDRVDSGRNEVHCTVVNSGSLGNKKGVNMPGLSVDLPAMSPKDREDIKWGVANDVDFIAASFVRKAADVRDINLYLEELLKEQSVKTGGKSSRRPLIVSKIESTEALQNFDSILAASDGIMIARGDLAVEIPMETLANVQKSIAHKCNAAGKPVIVATQMLESMQKNPRPTRAECLDVANAVYDGADCVMLSGESAKGKYPVASVETMKRIVGQTLYSSQVHTHLPAVSLHVSQQAGAVSAEHVVGSSAVLAMVGSGPATKRNLVAMNQSSPDFEEFLTRMEGMAYAAVQAAQHIPRVHAIVVIAAASNEFSGRLPKQPFDKEDLLIKLVSRYRPNVPIVCIVDDAKRARQLQLYSGVHPFYMSNLASGVSKDVVTRTLIDLNLECIHTSEDYLLLDEAALTVSM